MYTSKADPAAEAWDRRHLLREYGELQLSRYGPRGRTLCFVLLPETSSLGSWAMWRALPLRRRALAADEQVRLVKMSVHSNTRLADEAASLESPTPFTKGNHSVLEGPAR